MTVVAGRRAAGGWAPERSSRLRSRDLYPVDAWLVVVPAARNSPADVLCLRSDYGRSLGLFAGVTRSGAVSVSLWVGK